MGSASTQSSWYALRQCDAMGEVTSPSVELPLSLSVQYKTHKPRVPCQGKREREGWRENLREPESEAVGLMVAGEEAEGDPAGEPAPLAGTVKRLFF